MSHGHLAAYPWERLDRVPRDANRAARRVRRRLEPSLRLEALSRALGGLLGRDVAIRLRNLSPTGRPPDPGRAVHLETTDGAVAIAVEPAPDLASALVAIALGRAAPLTRPDATLDGAMTGALAAIAVEAARSTGTGFALRARSGAPPAATGLRVDATVHLDGRPYELSAWACVDEPPTGGAAEPDLAALGGLPLRLALVGAISAATAEEVTALRPGDVWLPREGWLHAAQCPPRATTRNSESGDEPARALLERAALSAPGSERGVAVGRSEDGRTVLRGEVIALGADVLDPAPHRGGTMANDGALKEIVLDAPVVVRVEVGSVTLTAREWAELRPGDVIETGHRIAEPAVLRVAGREVARGELVSVDGELGVRILRIVDPGQP